jgi:crossover junction endodeoxyribonuclease RuvC
MEADITSQAVGLASNTDFSLWSLFIRADFIVKSVILMLIGCSIYSWAIIIEKFRLFKRIKQVDKKDIKVIIEQVSAMPGQGVTSMFNFGQSFGILKGICSAMQLPMYFVRPAKWNKYFNLINSEKDASRTKAIEVFPYFSSQLLRKKDSNKADAILIASFYYETYKLEE